MCVPPRYAAQVSQVARSPFCHDRVGSILIDCGKIPRAGARHPAAAARCRQDRNGRRPTRQQRPRARYADGPLLGTAQARTTPARPLRALRRAGRERPRRGALGTGMAIPARTRVAEAGARARRGCPRPTAAGRARRVDIASHRTAPLPTAYGACAGPGGASTRGPAKVPEEPGDAALARSRRGRDRRPQPRAGPGLECSRAAPCIFPAASKHVTTVTPASGSGDRAPAGRSNHLGSMSS